MKIALHLRDRHVFIWQPVEILNDFNTLTLKQIFWKTKTFFKKLEYRYLVDSTKIENASFSHKTVVSEAKVKANRMVSTKWTYRKERSFASDCFFFWKFCSSLITSYADLIWCASDPNIRAFCKRWSFIWRCFFSVSIINETTGNFRKRRLHKRCFPEIFPKF